MGAAEIQGEYSGPVYMGDEEMTKREQDELQVLENLVASTQKKIDNAKKKYDRNKKDKEGITTRAKAYPAPEDKTPAAAQTAERSTRPDPQYRYVTPIEDPALVKKLVQQSLDSSITISTRELLSVAPDVRRQIKDQLVTKRIATTAFIEEVELK